MEKVKQIFVAILKWMQQNWFLILLVIGIIVFVFKTQQQMKTYDGLLAHVNEQTTDHQQQIADLREITNREQEQQNELLRHFHEEISRLETEHQASLARIEAARNTRRTQIVHDFTEDPTTLTTTTQDVFGIPVEGQ